MVKNPSALPETQETWVQSLGWEDPLEEGMAPHSSVLAWKIPRTEEPAELQATVRSQSEMTGGMEHTRRVYLAQVLYFTRKLTGWDPER